MTKKEPVQLVCHGNVIPPGTPCPTCGSVYELIAIEQEPEEQERTGSNFILWAGILLLLACGIVVYFLTSGG